MRVRCGTPRNLVTGRLCLQDPTQHINVMIPPRLFGVVPHPVQNALFGFRRNILWRMFRSGGGVGILVRMNFAMVPEGPLCSLWSLCCRKFPPLAVSFVCGLGSLACCALSGFLNNRVERGSTCVFQFGLHVSLGFVFVGCRCGTICCALEI